jgi:superfamily II helicase
VRIFLLIMFGWTLIVAALLAMLGRLGRRDAWERGALYLCAAVYAVLSVLIAAMWAAA